MVALMSGCGGNADVGKFPDPGHVVVQVRDTSDRPVGNVLVELKLPDASLTWRSGTTGADGRVEIGQSEGGVLPGDYLLTVQLPAGYTLGPAQPASTPLTVKERQRVDVLVTLAPA
ncbi:MAG: carboxypeptidase-like regulatory domain-containing protein [Rubrivivax sp.]